MNKPWLNDDEPDGDLTESEHEAFKAGTAKIRAFEIALRDLAREDVKYLKNRNLYDRWSRDLRLWWIARVTADAEAGKDTIGAHVVTRVVMNRLKG